MFKRVLAICLCVVAFIFSIIPASADSGPWIDLLSYSEYTSTFTVPGDGSYTFTLNLPSVRVRYVELGYRAFNADVTVYVRIPGGSWVTMSTFTSGADGFLLGSATINTASGTSSLDFRVVNNRSSGYLFQICYARASAVVQQYGVISASIGCRTAGGSLYSKTYNGSPVTLSYKSSNTDATADFTISIPYNIWSGFKGLNFSFITSFYEFYGYSVYIGDTAIPYEVSPIYQGAGIFGGASMNFFIDTSSIVANEFSSKALTIKFTGRAPTSGTASFQVVAGSGYIYPSSEAPSQSFFAYWFLQIKDWFANVSSWLGNIFNSVSSGFQSVGNWLSSGFQSVVDAIVGDTKENEEMENEAADQEQALGDLNSSLNDYEKPDPGSMNIDIQVDPVGLGFISGGLGGIYQSSIFGQILTMIGILGLAGYVFFGKR